MTDADRNRYHVMMLETLRRLVVEGVVLGFAQPGDDVETVHGRFVRRDTPFLEAPDSGDEREEWRQREVEVIDGLIASQKDLLRSWGISVEKH
jgi:hypothetical protein